MPYSDNLYSMVDDEPDIEQIGDSPAQDGNDGSGVASRASRLDARDSYVPTHMDAHEAIGSVDAVDDGDPHALSPTDGYFGAATDTPSGTAVPTSSNVPYVPNVLVEDPSLQRSTAESKAREAEQERLRNAEGRASSDGGNTPASPSRGTAASQNRSSSAYGMAPAARSIASSLQSVGATYYSSSSSTHSPTAATSSSPTVYSTRTSAYDGEHFPFLPREAPPAYTPSPTSPSNASGLVPSRNYRTFSQDTDAIAINMGRPEETQGLLAHQPESMRDHYPEGRDDTSGTWRAHARRMRQHANWGCCKTALIVLLLLLVTSGFLSSIFTGTKGRTGPHDPPVDKPQTRPGEPNTSYPEVDGGFSWDAVSFCKDTQIHRHIQGYDFSFGSDRELVLVEKTTEDDGRRGWGEVHTQGAVILRRAGPGAPDAAVTVEVTVTDERLQVPIRWDGEAGGKLKITVPHRVEWSPDKPRACVNVKVTVWVPENSELERLTVDAVHLDIKLLDNLALSVSDYAKLDSIVGSVVAASTGTSNRDDKLIDSGAPESFLFHSRSIAVKTTSSPIKGSWPLYDELSLQSVSGDIRVGIEPKEADANAPAPAALYVKSLSGDAEFREPILAAEHSLRMSQAFPSLPDRDLAQHKAESVLPPRDYRVDVQTTSGDITGAVAFSSWASFKSTSGTVSLDLLPVLNSSLAGQTGKQGDVELRTYSTSGATDVRVLDPLWVDTSAPAPAPAPDEPVKEIGDKKEKGGRATPGYVVLSSSSPSSSSSSPSVYGSEGGELRCLYSTHSTTSANIKLRYPESWEGDISLSSLTGFLQVAGDGVKLIKAGSDWPGVNKNMLARKGEKGKGGMMTGKSTSGGVDVFVGRK